MRVPQTPKRPVFVYLDDTGQQTGGRYLVVAAAAVTTERRLLDAKLEAIELRSSKGTEDWRGTSPKRLSRYLEMALELPQLRDNLYFRVVTDIRPGAYLEAMIQTGVEVADRYRPVTKRVFVPEGLSGDKRRMFYAAARKRAEACEVWNGAFNKHAIVRLVDSLAGLIAQRRFRAGCRKDFPELCLDWFVELT